MSEILHRKKLFGGRETAQQIHAEMAWGGRKCDGCGQPPAIRIQVFVALADMEVHLREAVQLEIARGKIHRVQMKQGPAVRVSCMHACRFCQVTAERVAARDAPSYAIVDIERGPGPDKPIVGVVSALS